MIMVESSKIEILNVIKPCGFLPFNETEWRQANVGFFPLFTVESENPGIMFKKKYCKRQCLEFMSLLDNVRQLISSVRQCILPLGMYFCYFYCKRLSIFSVHITICFIPVLFLCAPWHLGWGSRECSGAQLKVCEYPLAETTREKNVEQPPTCPLLFPNLPRQRPWVWQWGGCLAQLLFSGWGFGHHSVHTHLAGKRLTRGERVHIKKYVRYALRNLKSLCQF